MARIYGQANRVIVYFGEAADDSDMAFESIRAAADDENEKPTGPLAIRDSDEPILELLKRPWFQRIWILQEVGLARSILIICGSAEMNGYTFCSGVSKLESLLNGYSDLKSWILPTIRLIRRSIFRPKYNSSALGDLSLGELIDMYHNHKATVRHDKVYALLGMCSDQLSSPELLPDYTISWETLFRRLVKFILHKSVSIDVWDDREAAVIKSSGHVLGHVSSIRNGINRYPAQYIEVTFNDRPLSLQYYKNYGAHWTLQASATSIRKNDIVCLLDGASNPTIMRASEDHFGIIMIAVTLRQQTHKHTSFQLSMSSTPDYSHDFLLVWQWGSMPAQHSLAPQLPQIEINSLVSDYLKTNAIKSMRSFEVALILKDTGDHVMVEAKPKKDIKKYGKLFGIDNIHILSLQGALASVYWSSNRWKMAENLLLEVITTRQDLQGRCHQDTLNSKMGLARAYIDEEVLSRPSRAENLRGFRTELLNGIRSNSRIEEKIMILVVEYLDGRMLKLLLGLGRDSVSVTEKLVKAIFRPERDDGKILILEEIIINICSTQNHYGVPGIFRVLFEMRGASMPLIEEIVIAAVRNKHQGPRLTRVLLEIRGADINITPEAIKVVAKNRDYDKDLRSRLGPRTDIMMQLLEKRGADMEVTEEIVKMVTSATPLAIRALTLLFRKQGIKLRVTEEMVRIVKGKFPEEVVPRLPCWR
ncbi:het domain protein [Botrytis cinerea]